MPLRSGEDAIPNFGSSALSVLSCTIGIDQLLLGPFESQSFTKKFCQIVLSLTLYNFGGKDIKTPLL